MRAPAPAPRRVAPERRRISGRARGILAGLVMVNIIVLALVLTLVARRDGNETNVVNGDLRGSKPPDGRRLPDLAGIDLSPPAPRQSELRGEPVMLVSTCIECRSGDVIGGFLGRLTPGELPDATRVVIVGWDGDPERWRSQQQIPDAFGIHTATSAKATAAAQEAVSGVTESGRIYLYDTTGTWRSTFHLGQVTRDDVVHDLERLADP